MSKCICEGLVKGQEKIVSKGSWVNLYINRDNYDEYWIEAISDGRASMRIHYCPVCGRKLEIEEDKNDLWDWDSDDNGKTEG